MTETILQPVKGYPVTAGGLQLYLRSWKTVGACVLREQCTADGTAGVTASFPKGTRLSLEGKLAPCEDTSAVTAALAQRLYDGTEEDVLVEGLCFSAARLCAYTVGAGQGAAEVTLQFYTASPPAAVGSEDA